MKELFEPDCLKSIFSFHCPACPAAPSLDGLITMSYRSTFFRRFFHFSHRSQQQHQQHDFYDGSSTESMHQMSALEPHFIPLDSVSGFFRPSGRQGVSNIIATVFGATGFTGRYVTQALAGVGSQVVVPYRGSGLQQRHLKTAGDLGQIVPLPYDMEDEDSIRRVLSRSNVVFNGIGKMWETSSFSYHDANVKTTYQIAKLAKEAGVQRFIHLSHIGANVKSASEYYKSKGEAEEVVKHFFPNATIFRSSVMFGNEDRFINRYGKFGKLWMATPVVNNGMKRMQPVDVRDLGAAVVAALRIGETEGKTIYLGGPEVLTLRQVIDQISQNIFEPIHVYPLSDFAYFVYGSIIGGRREFERFPRIGAILKRIRFNALLAPDEVAQAYVDEIVPHGVLTFRDLGIKPSPLSASIYTLLTYYRGSAGPRRFEAASQRPEASSSL